MIKDKENRDKMKCEWCGKYEYNSHMEHNFAGDLCCFDCIDEANEETAPIKSTEDIYRLSQAEATQLLVQIIPYLGKNFSIREGFSSGINGLNNMLMNIRRNA